MAKKKEWITEKEAAEIFGLKPRTLREYCTSPKRKRYSIETSAVSRKMRLYNKVDIDQYINLKATVGKDTSDKEK